MFLLNVTATLPNIALKRYPLYIWYRLHYSVIELSLTHSIPTWTKRESFNQFLAAFVREGCALHFRSYFYRNIIINKQFAVVKYTHSVSILNMTDVMYFGGVEGYVTLQIRNVFLVFWCNSIFESGKVALKTFRKWITLIIINN